MGTWILIVEDEEVVRDMLAVALNVYGYEVATAATVQTAETTLQQLGPPAIGLVIIDINLTGDRVAREGYALYLRWMTAYPALRYLLISGDRLNATLPAVRGSAVPFLAKPFGMRELVDTVQALLNSQRDTPR